MPRHRTVLIATLALGAGLAQAEHPGVRRGHVMVAAGERGVLLFGGHGREEVLLRDAVWAWADGRWRNAGAGPPARTLPAAAWDSRRGVLVVYGGIGVLSDSRFGDTWEWDGSAWSERNVRTPGARDHHAMAYDARRGRVVMFGGQGWDRSFATDTWEWDGAEWVELEAAGPPGRAHHAMAYDARRAVVVLFGGVDADGAIRGDIWEWDGRAWSEVAAGGPEARARHRMAWDPVAGRVVMHGGNGARPEGAAGFRVLDDLWSWDGSDWRRETAGGGLGPRFLHGLAFDEVRGRLVLYGGSDGGSAGAPADGRLWELDSEGWRPYSLRSATVGSTRAARRAGR